MKNAMGNESTLENVPIEDGFFAKGRSSPSVIAITNVVGLGFLEKRFFLTVNVKPSNSCRRSVNAYGFLRLFG